MNNAMKLRTKLGVAAVAIVGVTAPAHAALSQAITDAFDAVSSDAASMGDLAWPIVVSITLTIVGIGLFKKFIGKAAS
ncbi:major coat protein [Rheinheimera sp.]|uniref:major coat protein n=1 Tax=Rheinheimera sp. TaxID=1869214 RepID=UPI00307F9E51